MGDINVVQRTQRIIVDMASASASVINAGPQGPAGISMPAGGTTGQILAKVSDDDYDVAWIDPPA